jgi:hypothetical protein
MRIGDIVSVDVGSGPSVTNYVGVVTRSDSWNGIWVTSTRGSDGDIAEQPLAEFAAGGILRDRPDLAPKSPEEESEAENRNPLAAALFVAVGAVATVFALRRLVRFAF